MSGRARSAAAAGNWPFGDLPRGKAGAILVDPPWDFRSWNRQQALTKGARSPRRHYPTMSLEQIKALPVRDVCKPDAHLFLWVTGPILVTGVATEIIRAWGFKPSSMGFVWIKLKRTCSAEQLRVFTGIAASDLHVGLGLTTRKNPEFCLLGRRGNAKRRARDVREVILAPVREHSRKPDETHERIEAYCDGPYVELFARSPRAGWETWGNEREKFT